MKDAFAPVSEALEEHPLACVMVKFWTDQARDER